MIRRHLIPAMVATLLLAALGPATGVAGDPSPTATSPAGGASRLVAIRAAHRPGVDRVVFEFAGGLPELHRTRWSADPPTHDPSDLPTGAQGNAFLTLVWWGAVGHQQVPPYDSTYGPSRRAYDLPNVVNVVSAGDWEATLTFTIGVMRRPGLVRITALAHPARWVVDLGTRFPRRTVRTWFFDRDLVNGDPPYVVAVDRRVPVRAPARGALQRLFAGPTRAERREGLRFVDSSATGFTGLRISDAGVARVQLTGGCDGLGSTIVTVATQLMPTLRALPRIEWVKILDPDGQTGRPWGHTDSIPACLEP